MATTYIVSYDLRKSRNYPLMYKALDTLKAAKLLESLWLVTLAPNVGAIRLRDAIMSAARMDGDDGLIVIELKKTSDWATYNAQKTGLAWLRANIP